MNKDTYLDQLYNSLKEYNVDSVMRHVTEYDYIISEMLEENDDFEQIEKKLGTPQDLARSIAEEFNYDKKDQKQFEEPIINRNRKHRPNKASNAVAIVINIMFVIGSIAYFLIVVSTLLAIILVNVAIGFISVPAMIFFYIAIFASAICALALYMLAYNLKTLLINSLSRNEVIGNE